MHPWFLGNPFSIEIWEPTSGLKIHKVFIGTASWKPGVGWVQLKGAFPWRHLLLSLNSHQVLKVQKSSAPLTNLASCSSTWYHGHEFSLPVQLLLCTVPIKGQPHMYEALASQLSWPYCLLPQESMAKVIVITSDMGTGSQKFKHGSWWHRWWARSVGPFSYTVKSLTVKIWIWNVLYRLL